MKLAIKHNLLAFDPERDDVRVPESGLVLPMAVHRTKKRNPTIEEVIAEAGWRFDLPTVCKINGQYYGRAEWSTYRIAANDNVEFLSRPLGGGSSGGSTAKTIGAVVAMVALTALAPYAMAAIGLTGIAASIGSALLIGAGSLAISHFLKPKPGAKTDAKEEIYSFSFGGNQARPLQPIPVGYGRTLSFPDFAAPRYSEFSGEAMTEYALFALGCGRYDVEEVRISDTTIWTKAGGYSPSFPGITLEFVEPGQNVTLFPVNVVTATEVSGIELNTTATPGFTANAATTLARQLLIDLVWPSGAFVTYKERVLPTPTGILVEARTVNDQGQPTSDWFPIFSKTYSFAKQSQIRVTERIPVGPGRYEVRARRTNPSITGQQLFGGKVQGTDDVVWSALRAHIDAPQAFPRVTTMAIRASANEQLQGLINGQIGVIATRILPVWENGQFVEKPTRSIAWAALDMWRNTSYGGERPLSHVDFQSFVAYDAFWNAQGHFFDHIFKEPQSLDDALETILKAGRAFPAPVGDRLTIVRDEPRGLSSTLFTDYDIVRDSLEIDYNMSNEEFADGIIGQYVDSLTLKPAEVSSAPPGVTLAKPTYVQLIGVTQRAQAIGLVRFMAAETMRRRITVSWTARAEGRMLKRGAQVKLSSELPQTWGQSVELQEFDEVSRRLIFDQDLAWDDNALNHYIEIRRRDGQPWGPVRVTRGATANVAVVHPADLETEAERQGMTLADAVARSDLMDLPTAAFSPGQPRTFPVLITEGIPDTDGEHIHLTGVMDDPEVYKVVETGVPPIPPVPPIFDKIVPTIIDVGARIYQRHASLVLQAGWTPPKGAVSYEAKVAYTSAAAPMPEDAAFLPAYSGEISSFEAVVGGAERVYLKVRAKNAQGVPGPWTTVAVTPPPLVMDNQFFMMRIREDDLVPQVRRAQEFQRLIEPVALTAAASRVAAKAASDKGEAAITKSEEVRADLTESIATLETELKARFEENEAEIDHLFQTRTTEAQATAIAQTVVSAKVGDIGEATVAQRFQAVATQFGQLTGSYSVLVTAGGYWSGFEVITSDGQPGQIHSEFRIATDKLLIGAPGAGHSADYVFSVGTRNGVARVVLRGDLIADGSINANQINVLNLSAISANVGEVTAGVIRSANNKMRLELSNNRMTMAD